MPNKITPNPTSSVISLKHLPPTPVAVSLMIEDERVVFRTEDGDPLYTYDLDPPGESTYHGDSATQWVPLLAETGSRSIGDWATIQKPDGTFLWSYKSRAVYVALEGFQKNVNDGPWRVLNP